jgi:hypothetical protein
MKSTPTRLAIAAVVLIVAFVGVHQFAGSLESVAWAEVEEHFESVPFFGLTIYVGRGSASPDMKIEVWKSADSRVRIREGDKVIFARFVNGKRKIVAFDRSTKEPVNAGMLTQALLEAFLHPQGQFSLGTITSAVSKQAADLVPVEIADTAASREIAVFQMTDEATGENLRIWTLRDSKLPIQMQFRDPRNDEYGDFIFDYTGIQDPAFFDPNAFAPR